jgi:predicted ester cyclase
MIASTIRTTASLGSGPGTERLPSEALVRGFYADLDRSKSDQTNAERYLAPDVVAHAPGAPPLDRAGFAGFGALFYAGFPDLRHEVVHAISRGEWVAGRLVVSGPHTGPSQGLPPTGRSMAMGAHTFLRVRDDRIGEVWIQADFIGLLQQLGAILGPG